MPTNNHLIIRTSKKHLLYLLPDTPLTSRTTTGWEIILASSCSLVLGICFWNLLLKPGLGRSPREGHGNPLQYSCLETPMDRGALGGLQPIGSQRVRHDWSNFMPWTMHEHCINLTYPFHNYMEMHIHSPLHKLGSWCLEKWGSLIKLSSLRSWQG